MNEILQPVFDKAVQGVIAQGGISLCEDENTCAYRGVGGKKCAIGQLLSDAQIDMYEIKEGATPGKFPIALLRELVPGINTAITIEFLDDLQNTHDTCTSEPFVKTFKRLANEMASKWNLTPVT